MVDVPCASNVTAIIVACEFFVDVGWLCPYDKGAFEERVDDDELEVALLDLALDRLTHAFFAETPKDEQHCHNSEKDVAGRDSDEKPQIHAWVLILFEQSELEPNRRKNKRHHERRYRHLSDAGLSRRKWIFEH